MVRWLRQAIAVSIFSLRTLPRRLGSCVVAMVGIAGVIVVFVGVLAIAELTRDHPVVRW